MIVLAGTMAAATPPRPGAAQDIAGHAVGDLYSVNDFGGIGLLQTRTARMAPDGQVELGFTAVPPYRRYYIAWQLLPWAEINFRYTDITNVLDDGTVLSFNQGDFWSDLATFSDADTFLDRGFDFKIRLAREGRITPAVAVGIQDAFGDGLFGGEYVVFSKRAGPLDLSLGLGWGYLGSRSFLGNPFRAFGDAFDERDADPGRGGRFSADNFFAGQDFALFGGIEYFTPVRGLSVKLEYSGSNPAREPLGNALDEDLPVGFGINYRPTDWFDASIGVERGNSLMLRAALRTNLHRSLRIFKDAVPPPIEPRDQPEPDVAERPGSAGRTDLNALYDRLDARGVRVAGLDVSVSQATIRAWSVDRSGADWRADTARLVFETLPATVRRLAVHDTTQPSAEARIYLRDAQSIMAAVEAGLAAVRDAGEGATRVVVSSAETRVDLSPAQPGNARALLTSDAVVALVPDDSRRLALAQAGRVVAAAAAQPIRARASVADLFGRLELDDRRVEQVRLRGDTLEVTAVQGRAAPPSLPVERDLRALDLFGLAALSVVPPAEEDIDLAAVAGDVFSALRGQGFTAFAFDIDGAEAIVHLSRVRFREAPRNVGWVSRVLANRLPSRIRRFTVVHAAGSFETSRVTVTRREIERAVDHRGSPEEIWVYADVATPWPDASPGAGAVVDPKGRPVLDWALLPVLKQHIGAPDSGVYLADVDVELAATARLSPSWSVSGAVRRFLFGNLDQVDGPDGGTLPPVRSDLADYLAEGRTSIARLQVDFVTAITRSLYARASAGLFEPMFGGVGGELLYHPYGAAWAIGADLNWVRQRDFDQLFDFQDYDVVTGHLSLYYQLARHQMLAVVRGGRYLAGDYGVTVDVSRRFANGIRLGGFSTVTDATPDEFGQGSFDKGVYIAVPFELFWPHSSRRMARATFSALTRDGGQRLDVGPGLYELLEDDLSGAIKRDWSRILD